jgi:uncharacterized RDD family membrane protein YckC
MRWYYAAGSQKKGPVTQGEVEQLFANGTITSKTLVWSDLTGWAPYGQIKTGAVQGRVIHAQRGASTAVAQAACIECGRTLPAQEMVRYGTSTVCAGCKSTFFQKVKEGANTAGAVVYAGFWTRFGAKFIDGIILYIINIAISLAVGSALAVNVQANPENPLAVLGPMLALMAIQLGVQAAYTTFFIGKFRATPGKMALGIMVIMPDGGRVSYGRAFGRQFAEFLSGIILGIGYLMAAFDDEKRTLHDRICSTRVVKKQK